MSSTAIDIEAGIQRFLTDLPFYARKCLKIRTKQAKIEPLVFNAAQRLVHRRITAQRKRQGRVRAIILKARQEGVSTYVAARFFRRITLSPNVEALVIADERKRGEKLFEIYERFDRHLPPTIRPLRRYSQKRQHIIYDQPDEALRFSHPGLGSAFSVETAKDAAAGRAATYQMLHISELAFWERPDDTWTAIMQSVPDDDSEVIVESTANGVGNFFHNLWERAEQGESGFIPIFLPWWIHEEYQVRPLPASLRAEIESSEDPYERRAMDEGFPLEGETYRLAPEQLAWRRRALSERFNGDERAFRQEYPSTAEEAFLVSGNMFFDEASLARYRRTARPPAFRANLVDITRHGMGMVRSERGYLRVWYKPDPECFYVIFADVATGRRVAAHHMGLSEERYERGGTDFSCADVFDVTNRRFVAQYHGRVAPEVFAKDLYRLGHIYGSPKAGASSRSVRSPALIGVERNHSSGESVLRFLKDMGYPNLYYHRQMNRRTQRPTQVLGWVTNQETRMPMLDELARALREETIEYLNPDGLREMFSFVRNEEGKPAAQEGAHDDRVIAAAGALQMARWIIAHPVALPEDVPVADSPTGWG